MMATDLPSATHAPPRRQPSRAWRVRWARPEWAADVWGGTRWNTRWYVQRSAAQRLTLRLLDSGAVVEVDAFNLDHLKSGRFEP